MGVCVCAVPWVFGCARVRLDDGGDYAGNLERHEAGCSGVCVCACVRMLYMVILVRLNILYTTHGRHRIAIATLPTKRIAHITTTPPPPPLIRPTKVNPQIRKARQIYPPPPSPSSSSSSSPYRFDVGVLVCVWLVWMSVRMRMRGQQQQHVIRWVRVPEFVRGVCANNNFLSRHTTHVHTHGMCRRGRPTMR